MTGDVVLYRNGMFFMKGRLSADIIKSFAFKVSALHIENAILNYGNICVNEAAVFGVQNDNDGNEMIIAFISIDNYDNNNDRSTHNKIILDIRKYLTSKLSQ